MLEKQNIPHSSSHVYTQWWHSTLVFCSLFLAFSIEHTCFFPLLVLSISS